MKFDVISGHRIVPQETINCARWVCTRQIPIKRRPQSDCNDDDEEGLKKNLAELKKNLAEKNTQLIELEKRLDQVRVCLED